MGFMEFYDKGIKIFGFPIAYYGIIIAVGMVLGVFLAMKNAKHRGVKQDDMLLVACYTLPIAIIGARLYYMLFTEHSVNFFDFKGGGLAIYGAVIGGAIGVALACIIHKKNFLDIADVTVPSVILGQAIGRWGNFINQEAFGYEVGWNFFPLTVEIEGHYHLATFFYESVWSLAVFVILMILLRKMKLRGSIMCLYFIGYGLGRVWIEGLRTDSLYLGSTGIRVSQALSVLLIIFGISLLVYFIYKNGGFNRFKKKRRKQ